METQCLDMEPPSDDDDDASLAAAAVARLVRVAADDLSTRVEGDVLELVGGVNQVGKAEGPWEEEAP